MSIEAMAVVLHHSKAVSTEKIVLLGIANHDGDGGSYPSIATLAKYANVSERSVQRAIERLVEMGEVSVHVQGGGQRDGRYRTNRYEVLVTCPESCDRSKNHRLAPVDNTESRGDAHVTPDVPGVTPTTSRGDAGDVPGVTPTSPEPSLEPPFEPNDNDTRENNSQASTPRRVSSSDFEDAIKVISRVFALAKKRKDDPAYIAGIARNVRADRADEINALFARGYGVQRACETLTGRYIETRYVMGKLGMDVFDGQYEYCAVSW